MARPKKEGLDYFPLDVYLDDKFKFIEIKYKLEGFAIVIKLLQKIYANGYYTSWGEDEELLFTDEIRSKLDIVRNVVEECLKRDIFSREIYDQYKILTSRGIQKRYMEATKKRTSITIKKEFDLVSEEKTPVSEEKTPVNSTESTQSKGKESKVKKSKVKESREEEPPIPIPPNLSKIEKRILDSFGEIAYSTWFLNTKITEQEKEITIIANNFRAGMIKQRYKDTLEKITCKKIIIKEE